MMRFTIIVLAIHLIIQALEEEHILVYAHEGGDAGRKSLHYPGGQDISRLHPKELYNFTNIGAPRKLRFGRTTRTSVARAEKEQVSATNNDNWSFNVSGESKHLMVERKLGFHKKSKSFSFKRKPKKKDSSGRFVAFYDDYRGPARHPPRHNF